MKYCCIGYHIVATSGSDVISYGVQLKINYEVKHLKYKSQHDYIMISYGQH
jgi:hypothetical protein